MTGPLPLLREPARPGGAERRRGPPPAQLAAAGPGCAPADRAGTDWARPGRTRPGNERYPRAEGERRPRDAGSRPDRARPDGERRADRTRPGNERYPRAEGERRPRAETDRRPGAPRRPAKAREPFVPAAVFEPVFGEISPETRALLESFHDIVKSTIPLDSRRALQLGESIRDLSHELTDERGERRVGYMNEPAALSAYVNYFMWWNLVRLTRLFAAMPLDLKDGDSLADLGSGPLTLPIALWMARPDLRALKLSWYCVDISQGALAAGEEMFLHLAAKTGGEPWKIVRVKGECGISLRRKVRLVASANMFNELFQDNPEPLEAQAKRHARDLASYADDASSILVIEPGIPRSARFVSLLRDSLARLGFAPQAPCPHDGPCPFPGLRHGKWCHFVFDTAAAPARLHKLSEDAGLSKDRAALSFILASRAATQARAADAGDDAGEQSPPEASTAVVAGSEPVAGAVARASALDPLSMVSRMAGLLTRLKVRIVSDPIRLPDFYTGRYGCSEMGMVLVCGTYQAADYLETCVSGSCIEVPRPDRKNPERDPKTAAILIRLK